MKCWLLVKLTTLLFRFIVQQYHTYSAINKALKDKEVEGALIDVYVLSMQRHLSSNRDLRVLKVFDYQKTYGVVLAGPSMKLEKCFFDFAKFHKWEIYHKIEETIRIPVVCWFYYQKNYYRQRTSFFIRYSKLVQGVRFVWSSFFAVCFLLVYKSDCPSFSRLSVHPFVPLYACVSPMCRCLSVCLSIKLSVGPSVYRAFCLSVYQASVCLSSYLFFCLSLSSCLSVGLSVCLSVCQVVCLSVCLSVCPVHPSVSISGYKSIPNCPSLNIRHWKI